MIYARNAFGRVRIPTIFDLVLVPVCAMFLGLRELRRRWSFPRPLPPTPPDTRETRLSVLRGGKWTALLLLLAACSSAPPELSPIEQLMLIPGFECIQYGPESNPCPRLDCEGECPQ